MLLYQISTCLVRILVITMCWFCYMYILLFFSTTILSDLHASRSQCDWHSPRLQTSCVVFALLIMVVVMTSNLIEWSCSQYDWYIPRLQISCALFVMVVVLISDLIEWSCSGSQCNWHSPRLQISSVFFVMVVVSISAWDLIEWSCSWMQPIRPRSLSQKESWPTKQLWRGPWLILRSSGHETIVTRAMTHHSLFLGTLNHLE